MTSCFNSHFSCTLNWSNVFETNTWKQQNFSEKLFSEATFTYGTHVLAGKGLSSLHVSVHNNGSDNNRRMLRSSASALLTIIANYDQCAEGKKMWLTAETLTRFAFFCFFSAASSLAVVANPSVPSDSSTCPQASVQSKTHTPSPAIC